MQNIEDIVEKEINWNDKKSIWNKRLYYGLSIIVIIGSIVVASIIDLSPTIAKIISIIVAIITGVKNLFHFEKKWTLYRLTAERLKGERILFDNECGVYKNKPKDKYAENVKQIMSDSTDKWSKINCVSKKE